MSAKSCVMSPKDGGQIKLIDISFVNYQQLQSSANPQLSGLHSPCDNVQGM